MTPKFAATVARPKERQSVQVIARAASVLRALEGEQQGLSLAQIAQRVDLARSTVQRLVDALSDEHFVIAATPTAGVRLGPALIRLAASAKVDFDDITRPLLTELSQTIGETVDLSVLKGSRAVFVDQVQGIHRLRAVSAVGEPFPLYCTANGKALLSLLEDDKIGRLLSGPLEKLTPHTITRRADLLLAIHAARRSGVAYDNQEHTEGICAVGTAFLDPLNHAYAVSIPVPATRFSKLKPTLIRELLRTRRRILAALGMDVARP